MKQQPHLCYQKRSISTECSSGHFDFFLGYACVEFSLCTGVVAQHNQHSIVASDAAQVFPLLGVGFMKW